MDEQERLEKIKTSGPLDPDVSYLLALVDEKNRRIEALETKARLLSSHVAELTQEMENIRSDFGAGR